MTGLIEEAARNFDSLRENPYPGRGIVVGLDETTNYLVQVYWIMGRRANSRNRVFVDRGQGSLHTAPADPAKMKDPKLVIYRAMAEVDGVYIVSNGEQTDDVFLEYTTRKRDSNFAESLKNQQYEPDPPNHTSRITAICGCDRPISDGSSLYAQISLLRRSPFSYSCDRLMFDYRHLAQGFGYHISTYLGDGDPLPSFKGEPRLMRIRGPLVEVADRFWDALNAENRVSLAVKFIPWKTKEPSQIHIINKYEQVK